MRPTSGARARSLIEFTNFLTNSIEINSCYIPGANPFRRESPELGLRILIIERISIIKLPGTLSLAVHLWDRESSGQGFPIKTAGSRYRLSQRLYLENVHKSKEQPNLGTATIHVRKKKEGHCVLILNKNGPKCARSQCARPRKRIELRQ